MVRFPIDSKMAGRIFGRFLSLSSLIDRKPREPTPLTAGPTTHSLAPEMSLDGRKLYMIGQSNSPRRVEQVRPKAEAVRSVSQWRIRRIC